MTRIAACALGLAALLSAGCGDDAATAGPGTSSSGGGAAGGAGGEAGTGGVGAGGKGGEGGEAPDPCGVDNGGCAAVADCAFVDGEVVCTCDDGFSGDGFTCDDIDECADESHDCSVLAACENTVGSFECECNQGYVGTGVECEDVDECEEETHGCSEFGVCDNTDGSFTCTCGSGYEGDGTDCEDVDECAVDNGGCSELAICTNEPGGFDCECILGFEGTGVDCEDIDECAVGNGGCDADAVCTNTIGSRTCVCNEGYVGDGLDCGDLDECALDNGGCSPNAVCTNLPGSSDCECATGFTGDGIDCVDVDECSAPVSPCAAQASCTNSDGGFTCECLPPYAGNGVTCTCSTTPPVANAVAPNNVAVGSMFQLDGTSSSGTGLTYAWTPIGNAPPLSSATAPQPTATASTCAAFSYQLTVTDACGQTSSDTVTVDPPANGPHVSAATCTPALQCGSIANPWCQIAPAVANTAASPVMVAGAVTAYSGAAMRDGIDVLGGYEPTFTAPRNANPLTNGTVVATQTTAFSWGTNVSGTLDGFQIRAEHVSGPVPASADVLSVDGGDALLLNVDITGPNLVYAGEAAALRVRGSGWAFVQNGSTLRGPRGSTRSVGAVVAENGTIDLLGNATLLGGVAPESFGLRHVGTAALSLTGGVISGGAGTTTSAGIVAGGANYPGTSITNTTALGGGAPQSYGVLHGISAYLTIEDCTVHGQGTSNSYGVHVLETTAISVSGSELKGVTGTGTPNPSQAIGLQMGETSLLDATATIADCDIEGGSKGNARIGVISDGVPFSLTGSTVAGSNTPTGPALGVSLRPGFQPGDLVTIANNLSITGGGGVSGGSTGLSVQSRHVSLHAFGNQLIQGCLVGTLQPACVGISLTPGATPPGSFLIEENDTIIGGPGRFSGAVGLNVSGHSSGPLLPVVIQNNGLIAGNLDSINRPEWAYGIRARRVDATIVDNQRILGGYGGLGDQGFDDSAAGIYAGVEDLGSDGSTIEVARNVIHGGSGWETWGVYGGRMTFDLYDNAIDACGLEAGPNESPPDCVDQLQSQGLELMADSGSHIRNNYIFSGYAGGQIGCVISSALPGLFEHNACIAAGTGAAYGLRLSGADYTVRNNILDGGWRDTGTSSANSGLFMSSPFSLTGSVIAHNQLVPGPPGSVYCAAGTSSNTGICYTAASLNALNGAEISVYGNVEVPMGYVERNRTHPTIEGYHLDDNCVLAGLAAPSALVDDFDGDLRSLLTIGPDECN